MLKFLENVYMGVAEPSQGGGINNLDVTVNPSVTEQTLTVPEGYTGYGTITANPVTASIDNNIVAGNIKKDVDILGVTGTLQPSETVTATNLTGLSVTAGDKVYLKKQISQTASSSDKNFSLSWGVLNASGSKVICDSGIYDIATDTFTSGSTSEGRMTRNAVLRYEGSKLFAPGWVFEDAATSTQFYYCQDYYTMSWITVDNKIQINRYNSDFTSITKSWLVEGIPNTNDVVDICVVGNMLYLLKWDNYYYDTYKGVISDSASTITVASFEQNYDNGYKDYFTFNRTKFPSNSTADNKVGICGNFAYDTSYNYQAGVRLIRLNSSYEYDGELVTSNSDLSTFMSTGTGMTFNRGTGILAIPNTTDVGIFKYNPETVDFDTIGIISISSAIIKSQATVSNDLYTMFVPRTVYALATTAGNGYNAVPYALGADIITGTASENALPNATFNVLVNAYDKLIDKKKYNITIDSIVGDVNDSGVLQAPTVEGDLVFNGVKDVVEKGLYQSFANNEVIKSVSFPDLEALSNNMALFGTFTNCVGIISISFPKLKTMSGREVMRNAFSNCTGITSVSFPELETISGHWGIINAFYNCPSLISAFFPKLKTLSGAGNEGQFRAVFQNSDIRTIEFPMLSDISNSGSCFYGAFAGNKNLTSISFPALKTTSFGSNVNQFSYIFDSTTGQTSGAFTMHFPSNLEAKIQTMSGYPDFGATAGRLTLAFDLPATE